MPKDWLTELVGEHGGHCETVDNFTVVCIDGTLIKFGRSGDGHVIEEPPRDNEIGQLEAEKFYFTTWEKNEVRDFNAVRRQYLDQLAMHERYPASCPSLPESVLAGLEEAKARIEDIRETITDIDKEIAAIRESRMNPKQRELRKQFAQQPAGAFEAARSKELRSQIAAINI